MSFASLNNSYLLSHLSVPRTIQKSVDTMDWSMTLIESPTICSIRWSIFIAFIFPVMLHIGTRWQHLAPYSRIIQLFCVFISLERIDKTLRKFFIRTEFNNDLELKTIPNEGMFTQIFETDPRATPIPYMLSVHFFWAFRRPVSHQLYW